MHFRWSVTLMAAALILVLQCGLLAQVVFTGSGTGAGGAALAAKATFNAVGSTLTIDLQNVTPDKVNDPTNVLTGLFFSVEDASHTTPSLVSGTIAYLGGSVLVGDNSPITHLPFNSADLPHEWAYSGGQAGVVPGSPGSTFGTAASGYSNLSIGNLFDNSGTPADVVHAGTGGADFGLVSATGIGTNNGFLNQSPFVQDGVRLTFQFASTIDLNSVDDVWFQYGTALTEPGLPGGGGGGGGNPVPVPNAALILSAGSLGAWFGLVRRRVSGRA